MARSRKPKGAKNANVQSGGKDDTVAASEAVDETSSETPEPETTETASEADVTDTETDVQEADSISVEAGDDTVASTDSSEKADASAEDVEANPASTPDVTEADALSVADPEPTLTDDTAETSADAEPGAPDEAEASDAPRDPEDTAPADLDLAATGADPEGTGPADITPATTGPVVHEKVVERKGGFFPMLLGGVAAAAIGFGLSEYLGGDLFGDNDAFADETRAALSAQTDSLDALSGRIDGLETAMPEVDLSSVESAIAALSARTEELGQEIADMSGRLGALDTNATDMAARMAELEKAPMEAAVSPAAIEAYEEEIARLRDEVQATLSDVETQRQEIASMAEAAVAAERNAEARAARAELRASLASLSAGLDAGQAFAEDLAPLQASDLVTVPEVLSANAGDGIATQAELVAEFPDAARAALGAAREAQSDGSAGTSRLTGFLAEQLGARSVTPRDGDSPDAVLSRAEAAVRAGDLETALNEISTLPEPAQAALSDWVSRAETRAAALTAIATVSDDLDTE